MKRTLIIFCAIIGAAFFVSCPAYASSLGMQNWGFNAGAAIAGLPGTVQPIDEITFLGTSFVDQTGFGPGSTFTDTGAFSATGFQNDGTPIIAGVSGIGVSYELTAVFSATGVNGAVTGGTNQNFAFDAGGTLDIYVDSAFTYGTATSPANFYGADDGTLVASFSLLSGTGNFDFDTVTGGDGRLDIIWAATYLLDGVWTDEDGDAMATGTTILLTDSNNNLVTPTATQIAEWASEFGNGTPVGTLAGGNLQDFYTRSDGSANPGVNVVPEPGTIFLLGIGLLGLAGYSRKRLNKEA